MLGATRGQTMRSSLATTRRKGKNWSGVRRDARMTVACDTVLSRMPFMVAAFAGCPGGGAEDNKGSGVQWIRCLSRRATGVEGGEGWQDRAVTMGVTSIKEKGYIKGCGFLVVSLFRGWRQEQRRRHNERSRTWKVRSSQDRQGGCSARPEYCPYNDQESWSFG